MCFFYDHISGTLETIPWKDDKDMRIDKNDNIIIYLKNKCSQTTL